MRPPAPLSVRPPCAAPGAQAFRPQRYDDAGRRSALRPALAAIAIAAALMVPAFVHAAGPSPLPTADIVPDAPTRPPVPPDDPAVQARLPGCAVWTDRCVTCERVAGRIFCSNIGVACQPQAVECVRGDPAEEKKQEN
jgi:hypothetical protein